MPTPTGLILIPHKPSGACRTCHLRPEGDNLPRKLPRGIGSVRGRAYTIRTLILKEGEPAQPLAA